MKICFWILISITIVSTLSAQDCPNRIGDFILNQTTISNLPKICPSCDTKNFRRIFNGQQYLDYEVGSDDLNHIAVGSNEYFELFVDKSAISGWYSNDYALMHDSTRVLFVPSYLTDGLSVKNLLLKFHKDTLFFIQASLSKDYQDILFEKYKGKGHKTSEKKTKNKCKTPKLQKFMNTYSEYLFTTNIDSTTYSKFIFDFGISSDCNFYNNNHIEIFNLNKLLKVIKERNKEILIFLEKEKLRIKEDNLKSEKEKENKMSRF